MGIWVWSSVYTCPNGLNFGDGRVGGLGSEIENLNFTAKQGLGGGVTNLRKMVTAVVY